jgi:hypothetical protein
MHPEELSRRLSAPQLIRVLRADPFGAALLASPHHGAALRQEARKILLARPRLCAAVLAEVAAR